MLFYKISANRIYTIYMQCAFQMPTGAKHFMFRSGADTSSMFLKFSKGVFPSGQSKPQLLMEQNRQLGVAASPLVSSIWGRKSSAWPNILPLPSVLCQLKKKSRTQVTTPLRSGIAVWVHSCLALSPPLLWFSPFLYYASLLALLDIPWRGRKKCSSSRFLH